MKKFLTAVGLAILCGLTISQSHAATTFHEARGAVHIFTNKTGSCSASVIAPNLILTAGHCVMDNALIIVNYAPVHAKLVAKSDVDDLSLYSADVACPCLALADSDAEQDEPIAVIGYPVGRNIGFVQFITYGFAQGLNDKELTHSAPTVPGNSGGPVIALRNG